MKNPLKTSLQKGLSYLKKNQDQNGSFPAYIDDDLDFKKAKLSQTIFPSCLILSCLSSLADKKITSSLANYLLSQKSQFYTFNYWERNSPESQQCPYPEDLDDTFCALSALWQYDNNLIDGNALANIVSVLSSAEQKEGGPYRTWLVPTTAKKEWKDIDIAVNSNVAYFLSLQEVSLPNINSLVEKHIKNNNFTSPYYASIFSVIYFISRFYKGKLQKKLIELLLSQKKGFGFGNNDLDTALAILALLNLDYSDKSLEKSILFLQSQQQKNGSWKAAPFVVEKIVSQKKYYSGSAALTTAFCLAALDAYKKSLPIKTAYQHFQNDPVAEKIAQTIFQSVQGRFAHFDKDFQAECLKRIEGLAKNNTIILLPYHFKLALGEKGKNISLKQCVQLGLANCFGWAAYDIYDDFLDQTGKASLLPLANICLQQSGQLFYHLMPDSRNFQSFFQKIMDEIEETNFWETQNCRLFFQNYNLKIPASFPDFQNNQRLAGKSIGHALGPVAELFLLGYSSSCATMKHLIAFFRAYLVARQLNDDAHDWEEDLKNGQLTPVVVAVLKDFQKKYKKNELHLKKDLKKLQKIFWYQTVIQISKEILFFTAQARNSLKRVSVIKQPQFLERLLLPLEQSTKKTLQEQKDVVSFLKNYA